MDTGSDKESSTSDSSTEATDDKSDTTVESGSDSTSGTATDESDTSISTTGDSSTTKTDGETSDGETSGTTSSTSQETSDSTSGDDSQTTETTDPNETGNDLCENASKEVPPWTGKDKVAPSQTPPCGLKPSKTPLFVVLGWDDNAYSGIEGSGGDGGFSWSTSVFTGRKNPAGIGNPRTYDGTPTNASYYLTSTYIGNWMAESPTYVKKAWNAAYTQGFEIGNHTFSHSHGDAFSTDQWQKEIADCNEWVSKPFDPNEVSHTPDNSKGAGVPREDLIGFRTPFLEYNDATLKVVQEQGFHYDCSIEEGYQAEHNPTNYNWPYTLDEGSPGHDVLVDWELKKEKLTPHPGLWELPVYPVVVPPDEECEKYGVPKGLRAKLKAAKSFFDEESGKITGFDYNLWVTFSMNKAEFLATLKYTFDLHYNGNRTPFFFGTHSDYYSSKYTAPANATPAERREAIEEFIDYTLTKSDARVVSASQVLDWLRAPVALDQK